MNLVVFTPALRKSAIGRMAALVTKELKAHGHQVTVVRTETEALLDIETHDFGVPVVKWNDSETLHEIVQGAETCIYQIGDHLDFHKGGVHWLSLVPGLVCLHDFYLGHLFYEWAKSCRGKAASVLQTWYGDEIAQRFFSFSSSESLIEGTRDIAPMTEWICSMADGVITHSNWGCDRVLNACTGPVRVVPLPYDAPGFSAFAATHQMGGNESLRLLTIGHVNPNKRVASVIEAIGHSPILRQRVIYRLVGHVYPKTVISLSALARELGVRLVISGELDDSGLLDAIEESQVIACLRWPSLEAASASAIEAMLYGKPVIVTDTGFYAEIPDSCAIKVAQDNEVSNIRSALELLLADQRRRDTMAADGQRWAAHTFSAGNYACQLIDIAGQLSRIRPAKRAVDYFRSILREWSATCDSLDEHELGRPLKIFENHH